ncbi:thiol:disulfide interchange protein DsbA/DsbL [Hydrogenophaga sp.]|uniref:thiol:disulfide interchange protein DsbA/DsbL n=1 Tax=Hydrogenophaga sp. TaxID=1904254 RepID=UPI0035AEF0FE
MQRRDFSRNLLAASATAALGLNLSPALAQRVAFKEGTDFTKLPKPVPTDSAAGQVEVLEFFAYSCIHCFNFEPIFSEWVKKQPAQVRVLRVPVAFNQNFVPMQRFYYALESMGLLDKLHAKVFKAFHEERLPLTTPPAILAWVEKQGVDRGQFIAAYDGPAAKAAQKAVGLQDAYQVEGTPAIGVAGRFIVPGQGPKTLLIADSLIAEVRRG